MHEIESRPTFLSYHYHQPWCYIYEADRLSYATNMSTRHYDDAAGWVAAARGRNIDGHVDERHFTPMTPGQRR